MALRLAPVPDWTIGAVRNVIAAHANVFEDSPQIPVERGELAVEKVRVTLPVFTAGVPKRRDNRQAAIAHGKLWLKPKQIAWRTLIETKQGVTVAVELRINRKKDSFHQLQYGPSIQQTFDALKMTERSRRLGKQEFSVGILQIPALYFGALRVTTNRGRELYVPLVNFPGRLKAKRFYQRKQIVTALVDKWIQRREARKKLAARKAERRRESQSMPRR